MKRLLPLGAVLAVVSSLFAACTMDFDQFHPSGGGGEGGEGGTCGGECCNQTQCPTPANACMAAACINSTCSEVERPNGFELMTQKVGDCRKQVCQSGKAVEVIDDDDPPVDANECVATTCNNGMTMTAPEGMGTPCNDNGGNVCDGISACVECLSDADCSADEPKCDVPNQQCVPVSCRDGELNGTETDVDCGGPDCGDCQDGDDCVMGGDCISKVCDDATGTCSSPTCDDGQQNGTETDVDCSADCPDQCGPGQGCNADDDCEGDDCTGIGGTCVPNCDDDVLNNAETDVDCGGPDCGGCSIGEMCAGEDDNCLSGNCGPGDVCTTKPVGATCNQDFECMSGDCEDGYCCLTSCNDECESCAVPGSEGTCTNVPAGTDPDNECFGTEVCDGNGDCKRPQGAPCMNGTVCITLVCADGVCCDAPCSGLCRACNVAGSVGTCEDVPANTDPANECSGATSCDGDGACNQLGLGQACTMASQCQSNNCVDNVCCNEACAGLCRACDLTGTEGTCTNVPDGQDPDNECPGGNNCNGMGACP